MTCPKYWCTEAVKNATLRGKQRYKCKVCGCNDTRSPLKRSPLEQRLYAIKLYLEGVDFRGIAGLTGVAHTTIMLWVKHLADEIERLRPEITEQVMTVELDEMWHFIQKKEQVLGLVGLR